jgi:hypothetical protein
MKLFKVSQIVSLLILFSAGSLSAKEMLIGYTSLSGIFAALFVAQEGGFLIGK